MTRKSKQRKEWLAFVAQIEARMEAGRREYGEKSFSRDPLELLAEIREELADVAGWSFILWCRLREMERMLDRADKEKARKPFDLQA